MAKPGSPTSLGQLPFTKLLAPSAAEKVPASVRETPVFLSALHLCCLAGHHHGLLPYFPRVAYPSHEFAHSTALSACQPAPCGRRACRMPGCQLLMSLSYAAALAQVQAGGPRARTCVGGAAPAAPGLADVVCGAGHPGGALSPCEHWNSSCIENNIVPPENYCARRLWRSSSAPLRSRTQG